MPGFILNATNVTMDNITQIANASSLPEMFININQLIYGGWLFFILLWVLWIIMFITANKVKDQMLSNAMYSGAIITILSFILRGVVMVLRGAKQGLLTDYQMWVFPLITVVLVILAYATKED